MPKPLFEDNFQESTYVHNDEAIHLGDSDSIDSDPGDSTLASLGLGDFFEDPDSGRDSDFGDSFSVGLLGLQEDYERSPSFDSEFSDAAQGIISNARKRRQARALENFGVEDFDTDNEKQAFLIVKMHTDNLFDEGARAGLREDALLFFFTDHGAMPTDDITFELCCSVLQARADVIRLRLQYEWWLRGTLFTGSFPFDNVALPDLIQGEILLESSILGMYLASEIWAHPSITSDELTRIASLHYKSDQRDVNENLEKLATANLISLTSNRWYVTGRNPQADANKKNAFYAQSVRGGTYNWSSYFKL